MSKVAIVGAGEAGCRAAFALREQGFSGSITLVGDEGCLPYERPPLSKSQAVTPKWIATESQLAEANIDTVLDDRVVAIDRAHQTLVMASDNRLTYDHLILATGARPRPLGEALVLRSLEDAKAIFVDSWEGRSIVIIGAGLIGLELAATLNSLGASARVVEGAASAMARAVPAEIASKLVDYHRNKGVRIEFNQRVSDVGRNQLTLASEGVVTADLVVAAIGVIPNVELAESCGLAVENGIQVDECLQTEDSRIFACGDCASVRQAEGSFRRFETWRSAREQAEHVACSIASGTLTPFNKPAWFWSDQYDLGLQAVGDWDQAKPYAERVDKGEFVFQLDAQSRLTAACGLAEGNAAAKTIKLMEMLLKAAKPVAASDLSDPTVNLKRLLKG